MSEVTKNKSQDAIEKKETEGITKQVKKKPVDGTKSKTTTGKTGTTKSKSTTKKADTTKSKSTNKVEGEVKSKETTEPKKTTKANTSSKTTNKTISKPANKKADKDGETSKNKIKENQGSIDKEAKQEEKKEAEIEKIEQEQIEVETPEEIVEKQNDDDESKYDTISLKEIREALENKVDNKQKKSVFKEVVINIGIAILMIVYLGIIIMGSKNIDVMTLEKDLKIMTLGILALGIAILEVSYKNDKSKIALIGVEILVFGAANLCLIYISKLYMNQLVKIVAYISIVIGGYYIVKSIVLAITSISKFKKDNSDIKDIVMKKAKVDDENEVEEN